MVKQFIFITSFLMYFGLNGQNMVAVLELSTPIDFSTSASKKSNNLSIPFALEDGLIYTTAIIDDSPASFILDTGAPVLVINDQVLEEGTAEKSTAFSCSNGLEVGWATVSEVEWAGERRRNIEAAVLDLSHFHAPENQPVFGLIGYELFRNKALVIDYEQSFIHLLTPKALNNAIVENPVATLGFQFHQHLPIVTLMIQGVAYNFAIDTGASTNLLSPDVLNVLAQNELEILANKELQGLDQEVYETKVIALSDIAVSPTLKINDEFLICDLSHLNTDQDIEIHGLLGTTFLSQFLPCLNYPKQELLLWAKN